MLLTRSAAILLGIAAAFSMGAVFVMHTDLNFDALSPLSRILLSIAGATGAFGFLPLLFCMGYFWLKCDESSRINRTIWFVVLLAGFSYGSQIAYYAIVYLPAVMRYLRNPEGQSTFQSMEPVKELHRIGPFRTVLLIGWGFIFLATAASLILPKSVAYLVGPIAACFAIYSVLVILEAAFHAIFAVYRTGLSRTARSRSEDSVRPRRHE